MNCVPHLLHVGYLHVVRAAIFLCPALPLYSLTFLYLFMTVRFPSSLSRVYNISGCALDKRLPLNNRS